MAIVDYAYPNTRIRVMKSLFLKNSDVEALTRAKNLEEYLMSLRQTLYGGLFSGMEKASIHEIERVLSRDLTKTIDKIRGMSPKNCTPLLHTISEKYLFECIKLILNSKAGNLSPDEIRDRLVILERSDEGFLSGLINLSVEDITALSCKRFKGLDEFMPESPLSLDILVALDRYYFSKLQNSLSYLNRGDRKTASRLITLEIDAVNLMIILRSITHGYGSERFIIPNQDSYLTPLDEYPSNVAEFIEKLSKTIYGPVLTDAVPVYKQTNSLLDFELALKRLLIKENKRVMNENPFQIGFILGFLKLKGVEIENLKAVCTGIGESLNSDEIRGLLVMPSS
jgi:vacuolar-type H+-ATPase subunit C/Vma6